jgi:hypothetical protein
MRKFRTRQHVIEDLGFNFIEKQVFLTGAIIQRYFHDYGYDGEIQTFDEKGLFETGYILFQLKSTDFPKLSKNEKSLLFDLSKRDLELWLFETVPVVLVLYCANWDKAYFIELTTHFKKNRIELQKVIKFVRIQIPLSNTFDVKAVNFIRDLKNKL